jgi:hypothetical protein
MSNHQVEKCCEKCKGSGKFFHLTGSHSDDRGGDPCDCTDNDCFHLATDKKPCECHVPHQEVSEEWENQYPLNTFTGETKKELISFIRSVRNQALESAAEALEKEKKTWRHKECKEGSAEICEYCLAKNVHNEALESAQSTIHSLKSAE